MERIFGYTLCYLQLVVVVSLVTNVTGSVLAVKGVYCTRFFEEKLYRLVGEYGSKLSSKELLDNLQFGLQCCGSYDYKDWFESDDWINCNKR